MLNWHILLAVVMASIPALVWATILLARTKKHKRLLVTVFLGGTLTVFPVLGAQWLYHFIINAYPNVDFVQSIEAALSTVPFAWTLLFFVYVGITEEIAKFLIVRYADYTRPDLIQTINDSVAFAILGGLGFAFSENIVYFYRVMMSQTLGTTIITFVFRSVFTVCAHAMFSGIFGYFYGTSKFSHEFIKMKEWQGKSMNYLKYFRKLFGEDVITTFRYYHILIGLVMAMGLHATFNIYLELGKVLPVVILVGLMVMFLTYLMRSRAGRLEFILADEHHSTMKKEDEDVIMELIGMWFKEERYQDVINICKRLLRRDPDNDVAKLFLAKSIDKKKGRQFFRAFAGLFKEDEGITEKTILD